MGDAGETIWKDRPPATTMGRDARKAATRRAPASLSTKDRAALSQVMFGVSYLLPHQDAVATYSFCSIATKQVNAQGVLMQNRVS
jgi:hypothetical protein